MVSKLIAHSPAKHALERLSDGFCQEPHQRCGVTERLRDHIDEPRRACLCLAEILDRNEVLSLELVDHRVLGIEATRRSFEAFAHQFVVCGEKGPIEDRPPSVGVLGNGGADAFQGLAARVP